MEANSTKMIPKSRWVVQSNSKTSPFLKKRAPWQQLWRWDMQIPQVSGQSETKTCSPNPALICPKIGVGRTVCNIFSIFFHSNYTKNQCENVRKFRKILKIIWGKYKFMKFWRTDDVTKLIKIMQYFFLIVFS